MIANYVILANRPVQIREDYKLLKHNLIFLSEPVSQSGLHRRRQETIMANKVWFITGISRGLGHALAQAALERGDRVIGTTREGLAPEGLSTEKLDVLPLEAGDAASIERAMTAAFALHGRIESSQPSMPTSLRSTCCSAAMRCSAPRSASTASTTIAGAGRMSAGARISRKPPDRSSDQVAVDAGPSRATPRGTTPPVPTHLARRNIP